jgi:copper chaperone
MSETVYTVRGIHCQSCVANIKETVGGVSGVQLVEVDLAGETVVVRGESFDDDAIRAAIASTGYQAA